MNSAEASFLGPAFLVTYESKLLLNPLRIPLSFLSSSQLGTWNASYNIELNISNHTSTTNSIQIAPDSEILICISLDIAIL